MQENLNFQRNFNLNCDWMVCVSSQVILCTEFNDVAGDVLQHAIAYSKAVFATNLRVVTSVNIAF